MFVQTAAWKMLMHFVLKKGKNVLFIKRSSAAWKRKKYSAFEVAKTFVIFLFHLGRLMFVTLVKMNHILIFNRFRFAAFACLGRFDVERKCRESLLLRRKDGVRSAARNSHIFHCVVLRVYLFSIFREREQKGKQIIPLGMCFTWKPKANGVHSRASGKAMIGFDKQQGKRRRKFFCCFSPIFRRV